MRQKGFAPIIILLVIFVLVAAGYFAYTNRYFVKNSPAPVPIPVPTLIVKPPSSPDPTANWKTYSNPKIFFQFKYPSDYTLADVSPNEGQKGKYVINVSSPTTPNEGNTFQKNELGITIFVQPENFTRYSCSDIGCGKITEKNIKIGDVEVVQRDILGSPAGESSEYYFTVNNLYYKIDKYPFLSSRDEEFNLILSTFKFTQ